MKAQKTDMIESRIFSISKAAKYLGVFPLTLRNWEKKGKIKAFRTPGGHRRFRKSDLDVLLGLENGRDKKLRTTIENFEAINFFNSNHKNLNKLIEDLKNIVDE